MLITIRGFPAKTKYADVKTLIKEECKLDDFMLGNLMGDSDGTKKIRIGLSDDNEGYMVMKRLDGYRMGGNFVLKTVPVGKPALVTSTQNTFDARPNFSGNTEGNKYPNPSRSDFQPRGVYQNQPSNSYGNRGPLGSSGTAHGMGVPPQNEMSDGRPSQWAPNTGPWASIRQSNPIANQLPQNNFNYPQQVNIPQFEQQHPSSHSQHLELRQLQAMSQEQRFGFPAKNMAPDHGSRQLRSIETVEAGGNQPPIHGRFRPLGAQFQQDKPITIMKENFQGPTSFNINNPTGLQQPHFPEQAPQPWEHHGQQAKPPQFTKTNPMNYQKPPYEEGKYHHTGNREMSRPDSFKEYEKSGRTSHPHALRSSPTGRRISPTGRRISPSGRRFSPPGRKISPSARRHSPSGRRFSPSGRRFSPPGKRISPTGRRISPFGRRISPSARAVSPGRHVSPNARRFSPSGRRISPNDRRMPAPHPTGRRESPPPKRVSPGRRIVSPHRRPSPGRRESPNRFMRYSPGRHHADKPGKHVRPAYEPPHQAPNQAIYPGGFRPNIHENVQHSGMRQDPQRPQWQRERDEYIKTQDEETRGTLRKEISRDRNPQKMMESQRQLPSRKSRSPVHRDRSPIRDRFKRHSLSPRSPRRSWAFEKRHSPDMGDAPPPPTWPGQKREDGGAAQGYRQARPVLARDPIDQPQPFKPPFKKDDQHLPKWERAIEDDHNRRPVNEDSKFYKPPRELDRERHPGRSDRFAREPHFSPRAGFDIEHHDDYHNPDTQPKKPFIQREDSLKRTEDRRHDERRRRGESPHQDIRENLLKIDSIDKDFEDIYQRTLQFKKKAEEMRRSANRRGISEDVGHHSEREREEDLYEGDYGEDENRREERLRQDYRHGNDGKAQNRNEEEHKFKRIYLDQSVKAKRAKAIEEITSKIMGRHPEFNQLKGEQKLHFLKELNEAISRLVFDMFGNKDVSFIEIIVKYQAKYNVKEEEKLLQNIVECLPSQYRIMKRHAPESCNTPAKMSKSSPGTGMNPGKKTAPIRLNTKPGTEEARRTTKTPAQRAGQPTQSANTSTTISTKEAREEKNRDSLLPPSAQPAEGHYELSPLMTRMVESEIKNVMIKVWQALPDNPASESDKHVVDKFRSTAGDDLMNVLGFNITQRLLNVYNPLAFKVRSENNQKEVIEQAYVASTGLPPAAGVEVKGAASVGTYDCTSVAGVGGLGDLTLKKRKNLSGNAKRKRRAILRQQLALKQRTPKLIAPPPVLPLELNSEAVDSTTETKASDLKQAHKVAPFRNTHLRIKLAIIAEDYPRALLTREQESRIKEEIWKCLVVMSTSSSDPAPVCLWGKFTPGAVYVTCEDYYSASWLKSFSGQNVGGKNIKVIEANDLPKPVKMAWKRKVIANRVPLTQELNMLQHYNRTIFTGLWNVVHTTSEGLIFRSIVLMDQTSAEVIREAGYVLLGFHPNHFKLLEEEMKDGPSSVVKSL